MISTNKMGLNRRGHGSHIYLYSCSLHTITVIHALKIMISTNYNWFCKRLIYDNVYTECLWWIQHRHVGCLPTAVVGRNSRSPAWASLPYHSSYCLGEKLRDGRFYSLWWWNHFDFERQTMKTYEKNQLWSFKHLSYDSTYSVTSL